MYFFRKPKQMELIIVASKGKIEYTNDECKKIIEDKGNESEPSTDKFAEIKNSENHISIEDLQEKN